jgi:hypothetical protein
VVNVDGLAVHPYFQKTVRGPERLLDEIEQAFPGKRNRVPDRHRETRASACFKELAESGYQKFKTEVFTPKITWVYLRKERT